MGCRLLKTRFNESPFEELKEFWDDIKPITFSEALSSFDNVEDRRIAISSLGIEKVVKEIRAELIDSKTIKKKTTWVGDDGEMIEKEFEDTYELYEVHSSVLGVNDKRANRNNGFLNYLRFKDTSTDREYLLWIDAQSVYTTNNDVRHTSSGENYGRKINAIQAIAWTIQTDISKSSIEKIVRQGDCILIKEKKDAIRCSERHLTESEYLKLLVAES
jgi:hypothetical protein